jgi:hypothetical protein
MINLHFSIDNPHKDVYRQVFSKSGGTPFRNKYWEFGIIKSTQVIGFLFKVTTQCDHAGMEIGLGFLGYEVRFHWYDNRHWDYKEKHYEW